jgi:uroporphyrinogen decarboxylase
MFSLILILRISVVSRFCQKIILNENSLFIRSCKGEKTERTPVWIMRQAGRYLPEYRAIRAKHDFMTMCKTPELASEVTVQPIDIIKTDAAILFSDILVIPEAMGMIST